MRVAFLVPVVLLAVTACVPAAHPEFDGATLNPCSTGQYWTRYYNNTDLSGTAALAQCEPSVGQNFAVHPAGGVSVGHFSVDARGTIDFPTAGDYQFAVMNRGTVSQVWLDGKELLDHNDIRHVGGDLAVRRVEAGPHKVQIVYRHGEGPHAELEFSVSQVTLGQASPNGNFFAANSFWNQPVANDAPADSRSAQWIAALTIGPALADIHIDGGQAVYRASEGTPIAAVRVRDTGKAITVPYLPSYRPAPGADGHMVVIDATGCGYEFESFHPGSMTAATQATYQVQTGSGGHVSGPAHSGGELSYIGGIITPEDVKAGVINHALHVAIPINSPKYVYPGTRSDGVTAGGVPEGTRMQLDPALDLRTLNLTPFQLMVATALQKYGAFDSGNADTFTISARSTVDGSTYPMPLEDLPQSLIGQMRFLAPTIGSTDIQLDSVTDTRCGQQH